MIIPVLLLLSLGITVIFTSSVSLAIQQLIFGVVGLVFFLFLQNIDFRFFKPFIKPLYFIILVLLLVTLFLGVETRGSVRWIPLGLFNLQPSEFAKPILILALANFWSKNSPSWINILKSVLILLPILVLIFRQPDLGTSLTALFIWVSILLASNASFIKLTILGVLTAAVAPLVWILLQDYQKQRFLSYLSPNLDPKGVGFHVIQSTIAVGSGEFLGRGLGRGTQSRLQFLPEFRTDFIFAFIAEELGFIGSIMVLVLYSIIFFLCFRITSRTNDRFGELICIGVMGMLFFQILVNIGMNTGLLPITGITLPLLSYGGSSVLSILISLGLVASVGRFGVKRKEVDTLEL